MLAPADAALVRRDRAVPGLATLLDPRAVTAWLRAALPGSDIGTVRPRYLRYKPGTSCLVAYDLSVDGRETGGYGKAHRAGDDAKAAKALQWARTPSVAGRGAVVDRSLALAFVFAPNDRNVPALGRLEPGSRLRRRLLAARPDLWDALVVRLVHKPERRAVLRLDGPDGPAAVVRCYPRRSHGRALVGALAATAADGVAASRLLAADPASGTLALTWAPGSHLDLGRADAGLSAAAGELAARLHRHPAVGLPAVPGALAPARLRTGAAALAAVAPSLAPRARALAARLLADMTSPAAPATVHGDLSADQVVAGPDGVGLLDYDAVGAGEAAVDLGRFQAATDTDIVRGRLDAGRRDAALVAFLHGYTAAGGSVDPRRVRLARSAALLELAVEPFRYRDRDWPRAAEALLTRAEAFAEGRLEVPA
ncbi:MAG TPA: hypothetical protein VIK95_06025 [Egibacteraceae bacterium]